MTVESLETAKAVVEEEGADGIKAVYKYIHKMTGKELYAIFLKGQYVDVFDAPLCMNPQEVFSNGVWKEP